ncbi:MAG TPA: hypothetical protein VJ464_01325 [Blastocatellia bacterium]|nr:hypothetical protein [Blastocatellia bacterium]
MEKLVLSIRQQLHDTSDLGEFGAAAILRELKARRLQHLPSRRTIGYILQRHGATDYRRRQRRPPPAPGWYLPNVAAGLAEIDEFDFIVGLLTGDGTEVEVLNVTSLHGGLVGSWPESGFTAERALAAMLEHWRRFGLPDYAQFDNDNRFAGPHQHADAVGRVIRACLSLGVVAVFAPPREHGLQNAIEGYNGKWQAKVWARFEFQRLAQVQRQSSKYIEAHRARSRVRTDSAPERRRFPKQWKFKAEEKISGGRIIFMRRSSDQGRVEVLGHKYEVDPHWCNRLVRCEVDIGAKEIHFYGLRRSEPASQRLLRKVAYQLPPRYIR